MKEIFMLKEKKSLLIGQFTSHWEMRWNEIEVFQSSRIQCC